MMHQLENAPYKFQVNGGAVGTYNLMKIPAKCYATRIYIGCLTTFTGDALTTIDVGYQPIGSAAPANPTAFAAGLAPGFFLQGTAGISIAMNYFSSDFAYKVTLRVNVAALTGGWAIFGVEYMPMPY